LHCDEARIQFFVRPRLWETACCHSCLTLLDEPTTASP
jgi:hypothetical protein